MDFRAVGEEETLEIWMILEFKPKHVEDLTLVPVRTGINVMEGRRGLLGFIDDDFQCESRRLFPTVEVINELKTFGEINSRQGFQKKPSAAKSFSRFS